MLLDLPFHAQAMGWPLALLLAWFAGERLHALGRIPRVSTYFAVGLLLGSLNLHGLTAAITGLSFLANLALALILFELGYRIHLHWLRHNPLVLLQGLAESALTFGVVFWALGWFDLSLEVRLILAALGLSTSPAVILRVVNETRSAGQVTDRTLHWCAINCLVAVLVVKLVVGWWQVRAVGDWQAAALGSAYALLISVALGAAVGVAIAWLLRHVAAHSLSLSVVFALAVLLLTTAAYALLLSPLLAALVFGIVARERRVQLTHAQRGFGSIGELLGVFLFVYVGSLIVWAEVWVSLGLALALLGLRLLTKTFMGVALARWSGSTWRKGALTGLALTPISAFFVLLLEQTRLNGFEPAAAAMSAMAALMLILGLLGPLVTQYSLRAARETQAAVPSAPSAASAPQP